MMFLSILVSAIIFLSINAAAEPFVSGHGNNTNAVCHLPFYFVGDQCLFIGHELIGTWSQMRDVCLNIEGDLVSLDDANLLYDINNYIVANGMVDISYWIGASDGDIEGEWVWTVDDKPVKMMSPIWGMLYGNQPNGGIDQNCGIISHYEFNYMHDEECKSMHGFICQAKQTGVSESTDTMPKIECPPDYQRFGSGCFQIYLEHAYTFNEAIDLCSGLHRHLAKLTDANVITDMREYLIGTNAELWIDGSDELEEGTWIHLDQSQVKRGTPFWTVYNEGQSQEPGLNDNYNCIDSYHGALYHFYDMQCSNSYGAICAYDEM